MGRLKLGISGALVCAVVGVGVAQGQVVLPPAGSGASSTVLSPLRQVFTSQANPSRSGLAVEDRLLGPLEQSWDALESSQVLIAGDLSILAIPNATSSEAAGIIEARRTGSGEITWRHSLVEGEKSATIATDGSVIAVVTKSRVTGLSVETGNPIWSTPIPGEEAEAGSPPVVDGGIVYLSADLEDSLGLERTAVMAFAASDGRLIWNRTTGLQADEESSGPSLDDSRVFLGDLCGNVAALSRADGSTLWNRSVDSDGAFCGGAGRAIAGAPTSDGRVFAADGAVLRATDGGDLGTIPAGQPSAIDGSLAFLATGGGLVAVDVSDGHVAWTRNFSESQEIASPVASAGLVWIAASTPDRLLAFDAATGELVSQSPSEEFGGVTLGGGVVTIRGIFSTVVMRPRLQPSENGVDLIGESHSVRLGKPIELTAGLGPTLRAAAGEITLIGKPLARGKASRSVRTVRPDGSAEFLDPVQQNTTFRAIAGGVKSRPFTIYAEPKYRGRLHYGQVGYPYILRVKGPPASVLRGRKVVGYVRRPAEGGDYIRESAVRMQARSGNHGRAVIPIPARPTKIFFACVVGLPQAGYGSFVAPWKDCGARRLRVPSP